jgi:hypothetical protein
VYFGEQGCAVQNTVIFFCWADFVIQREPEAQVTKDRTGFLRKLKGKIWVEKDGLPDFFGHCLDAGK